MRFAKYIKKYLDIFVSRPALPLAMKTSKICDFAELHLC